MPAQTETQADMIARLITERDTLAAKLARLQEAAEAALNAHNFPPEQTTAGRHGCGTQGCGTYSAPHWRHHVSKCKCRIAYYIDQSDIIYCPLHKAAEEMRTLLQRWARGVGAPPDWPISIDTRTLLARIEEETKPSPGAPNTTANAPRTRRAHPAAAMPCPSHPTRGCRHTT